MPLSRKKKRLRRVLPLLVYVFLFLSSLNGFAMVSLPDSVYNKEVSIPKGSYPMEKILKQIENQTTLHFSYSNRILPELKIKISGYEKIKVGELLSLLIYEHGLEVTFVQPNVVIINLSKKNYKETITISGFITDSLTGEKLIGANVYISKFQTGTLSNTDGFFSITVPKDSFRIRISYTGFQTKLIDIKGNRNEYIEAEMTGLKLLAIVEVSDDNKELESMITKTHDKIRLKGAKLEQSPLLLGEADVFRMLQLLPGIQSVGEGTPGLFVRGGSPDQNLILLDGVPIYNPVHIFGFYSVFNPSIVKDVQVSKGSFPARYGGRLSSVVEVNTKEGNAKEIGGEVSLGIIGAKATIEGPIIKDKTTFCLSARRSYVDLLLSPFFSPDVNVTNTGFFSGYHFLDLNAKVVHRFNKKSKLAVNYYNGRDKVNIRNSFSQQDPKVVQLISESDRQDFTWGNTLLSSTWSQLISKKSILRTTVWYNSYTFGNRSLYSYTASSDTGNNQRSYDYRFQSSIKDYGVSTDLDYKLISFWNIRLGGQIISHKFEPSVISFSSDIPGLIPPLPVNNPILGNESAVYIENQIEPGRNFYLNIGLHQSIFSVPNKTFSSLQPRIQVIKKWKKGFSINVGYAEMQQFLHLLTNSTIGIPNDLWVPTTETVDPQYNKQWNGGFRYERKNWSFGVEGFYKEMENVLEYKDEVNYLNSPEGWEDKITSGRGVAKGLEFSIEKTLGKTTGWVGYCISRNTRYFDDINDGNPFPFRYDRLHDLSVTLTHKLSQRIELTANFIYATGNAITLPAQIYPGISQFDPFAEIYLSGDRNAFRMPDYHRLDLNASFKKINRFGERMWSFGLYNAYNRMNPFYISPGYNATGKRVLRQVTLFPIIPSITYKQQF